VVIARRAKRVEATIHPYRTPKPMSESPPSPPSAFKTALFTVLGNTSLLIWTLVFGSIAMVVGWLPPRGRWMFLCARLWGFLLLPASGVKIKAQFEVPLDPKKGYVFMANHESMLDIPVLLTTLPGETRMLAKKSLFRIPVFGWGLSAGGFIPVDRGNRAAVQGTFKAAVRCLESGRSILVFPEERRSNSAELLPFKSGGFLMALKTGFPIVPVGIRGTGAVRPVSGYRNHPGPVQVSYGEPIDVADLGVRDKGRVMDEVREKIEQLRSIHLHPGRTA
jgi:1-acyl-sn-glycerol-3-phosphate acyltransferase